jgi:6-pyruvoyltetrahydropterin/6-carboxytetrahydropterin synthase
MFTIRKQFKFEMAHQLKDSYSAACHENLHGHSYVLELFFTTDDLNGDGMVVDFGEVKDVIGKYVDDWDHSLTMPIYFDEDYLDMLKAHTKKFRIMLCNPTAENMAKNMYQNINILLREYQTKKYGEVKWLCSKVRLHETTTGWAEYQN